jgi:hypothetical protein
MRQKALILFSCFLFIAGLTGCSLIADSATKKELMEQMDQLMDLHDKNMKTQRQMINDYTNADKIGAQITQALSQGTTMNNNQYNEFKAALNKTTSDVEAYRKGVNDLLSKITTVETKANELNDPEAKKRATDYLTAFKTATQSQVEYIDTFQNLINASSAAYESLSKGQNPDVTLYNSLSQKEGDLVNKFNKEIDKFNELWKDLNEKDFNRQVKDKISF